MSASSSIPSSKSELGLLKEYLDDIRIYTCLFHKSLNHEITALLTTADTILSHSTPPAKGLAASHPLEHVRSQIEKDVIARLQQMRKNTEFDIFMQRKIYEMQWALGKEMELQDWDNDTEYEAMMKQVSRFKDEKNALLTWCETETTNNTTKEEPSFLRNLGFGRDEITKNRQGVITLLSNLKIQFKNASDWQALHDACAMAMTSQEYKNDQSFKGGGTVCKNLSEQTQRLLTLISSTEADDEKLHASPKKNL